MVLATDLDGTFLAGEPGHRQRLYQLVDSHPHIRLVWVTGRSLEAVIPLLSDPALPRPDYLVCDVGATVVDGRTLQPLQPLQSGIDARWPGEHVVADAMRGFDGLHRQDVPQERRCSYFCDPAVLAPQREAIEAAARALGCAVLYSADRYLDILPPRTDKGRTLQALASLLRLPVDRILVAGDTLNDLSMYDAGFRGVCVGLSEPALLEATLRHEQVLHASEAGCGGILQAIEHFGLLPANDPHVAPPAPGRAGESDLVMVYHRLPFEEAIEDGKLVRRRPTSPNGIIPSLLSFFAGGQAGSWVAWTLDDAKREGFEARTPVDVDRYPRLTAARVPLSKGEVDAFYKRFSKEAFWPMLHTFWERARFREDDWKVFLKVNRRFAEAAAAEAAHGATVWLHDYNLWMVPARLRELRPDLKIAFFHHTYFPSADIFNVVPWRREILGSLLSCDYIGFHIPRQVENFVDVVRGAMPTETLERQGCAPRFLTYGCAVGLDTMTTRLRVGDREVGLGAHPVGTDLGRIRDVLAQRSVRNSLEKLRREISPRKLVLSIERLDYTKGTLEKLEAFDRLLEAQPQLQGKVTLVMVCVPAAKEMTIYRQLQTQIEQAVGRINGRYSRLDWTPVRFFARPLPFEEVVAHYAAADVMWITPLRDGLNLVAKEFVATQGIEGGKGVLVLSEFAGAAAEMKGALLTNPHDPADLTAALGQALAMDPDEAEGRLRQLYGIVENHDVDRWGRDFLAAVRAAGTQRNANTTASVSATMAVASGRSQRGEGAARA
ncbi:MAG TPA: glucosylglycerol-phosphate synthase [Arenimonas sp.]|uniref:glucosylglycerol-phosphate synthase n=1 Tax=Arenimonas sp. TaxID=1872635 RepID=UPI002D7F8065|nr:glucosylglycerol-phosphate synthase [Arenimonas sp.]HEU0153273.1 glucosylglycerol-phosphate synthase [Arenimonas sp.]